MLERNPVTVCSIRRSRIRGSSLASGFKASEFRAGGLQTFIMLIAKEIK